jgi:2'-5' RNA ligase
MAKKKLTALSDPDSVQFTVVEDYVSNANDGFSEDEIQRLLTGQPLDAIVAGAFATNEDKYDSGGMIALIPSDADLDRLTLDGEEPRDDLHLTLWYLGDDKLTEDQQEEVLRIASEVAEEWRPITGNAFGVAHWNPEGKNPAWVLNVGDAAEDPDLADVRLDVGQAVSEVFDLPAQHTPWQPHICIAYSSNDLSDELATRLGTVTFDKIRVAYGHDVYDLELDDTSAITAAAWARKRRSSKNLKDYWTKGEGLAKWAGSPHPWTTLYNHLKKHMPSDMAKRVASRWYYEVKGHWPGERRGKK